MKKQHIPSQSVSAISRPDVEEKPSKLDLYVKLIALDARNLWWRTEEARELAVWLLHSTGGVAGIVCLAAYAMPNSPAWTRFWWVCFVPSLAIFATQLATAVVRYALKLKKSVDEAFENS